MVCCVVGFVVVDVVWVVGGWFILNRLVGLNLVVIFLVMCRCESEFLSLLFMLVV